MNKQPSGSNEEKSRQPSQYAKAQVLQNQGESVNGALLVSRILYAVLIVGFMGYYLDKALQIVKQ